MDRNTLFYAQVQLLLRVLPFIAKESCFALKGGTAINLFVRDFPRLSVDIDLVFLPSTTRQQALESILNRPNYDGAWKGSLENYFKDFLELLFPAVHERKLNLNA